MLLATKDGICCDYCGSIHQNDFTYYSYDFHDIQLKDNILPRVRLNSTAPFSLDICELCMTEIGELVKKHHKPFRVNNDRRCPNGLSCDLTGNKIKGTVTVYYCHITKVTVRTTGSSLTCEKCSSPIENKSALCPKCSHDKFSKTATTNADERWLELYVEEAAYEQFKQKAIELRQSEKTKWSGSSG